MASFISGLLSSAVAYYVNNKALEVFGEEAITYGAPLVEEISKTFISIALGGNILFTHFIFGGVEAVYDGILHPGDKGKLAALMGIFSHGAFGFITVATMGYLGSSIIAVLAAASVHSGWNYAVMALLQK